MRLQQPEVQLPVLPHREILIHNRQEPGLLLPYQVLRKELHPVDLPVLIPNQPEVRLHILHLRLPAAVVVEITAAEAVAVVVEVIVEEAVPDHPVLQEVVAQEEAVVAVVVPVPEDKNHTYGVCQKLFSHEFTLN